MAGEEKVRAATRIQALQRGIFGRQRAEARRIELAEQRRAFAAALSIERVYRGHRARGEAAVRRQWRRR